MNSAPASDRVEIINCAGDTFKNEIKRDALQGLTARQKAIPSKYFYDAYGSHLFSAICCLSEYYQTRTELSILRRSAAQMAGNFSSGDIVEFGSGGNLKIRILLDAAFGSCPADICYVPVDVSESTLIDASASLAGLYPALRITGIVADFTKHLAKLPSGRKKLFLCFGSTIGNFSDDERKSLLSGVSRLMEPGDRLLLGIDMIKSVEILERAYNDRQGVTAAFNKNILTVLNRELNADFNKAHFDHLAFYDADKEQVEMHLRANREASVEIKDLDLKITLKKGETIQTEMCRKFSRESAAALAEDAGLNIERWFSDHNGWFSLIDTRRHG